MARPKVFSGAQPTGSMHIGNYLGAFRNWVALQAEYDCVYGIVDLHAITTTMDPAELKANSRNAARLFLSMGVDPRASILFVQSAVAQHAELAWVLGTLTSMGALNRMTQYKEKSDKHGATLGLFAYPVLQAADILLYRVNAVPIGEDQKQHLELTRDLAERFNNRYGDVFPLPEPIIPEVGARLMSLQEPSAKMSKSDANESSRIGLLDPPEVVAKKFSRAVTDSGGEVRYDPENKPGVSNLLEIMSLFSRRSLDEVVSDLAGSGYAALKAAAAAATSSGLAPLQEAYSSLGDAEVDAILADGAERAAAEAAATMAVVRAAVGLSD
jgi:tryptophanyl-tRNA synthetase